MSPPENAAWNAPIEVPRSSYPDWVRQARNSLRWPWPKRGPCCRNRQAGESGSPRTKASSSIGRCSGSSVAAQFVLTPGGLILLLVVPKGFEEPAQYFGRGLEHGLELRFVDLID